MTRITGSAPGKLVLTGDYIALLDAPALVLAVDRVATATLTIKSTGGWSVRSNLVPRVQFDRLDSLIEADGQQLLRTLVDALPSTCNLPDHAELALDTSTFYEGNVKLGVGSSAAILVALAEALGHVTGHHFTTERLIDLHNSLHGKNGSGLDVVAARLGGLSRFQNGAGERVTPPHGVQMRYMFTGTSTSTEPMLLRFRTLVEDRSQRDVKKWQKLANTVADSLHNVGLFLQNLAELNEFVFKFDQATNLGIYGSAHRVALKIAQHSGVLYKPCGAGGGDTGVALSDDAQALDIFERDVTREGLQLLDLTMENHGSTVQL